MRLMTKTMTVAAVVAVGVHVYNQNYCSHDANLEQS